MFSLLMRIGLGWTLVWLVHCTPTDSHISLAMDERKGLNPTFSSPLFSFHAIIDRTDIENHFDLVLHANWTALKSHYSAAKMDLPSYLQNNDKAIELFESKSNWKTWMHTIGLGSYVPHTYNYNLTSGDTSTIEFPAILKLPHHFGRGVFVVHDEPQLNKLVSAIQKRKYTYTLEEALTGMGLAEVAAFGSVYQGRLLSMRCIKVHFPPKNAARTAHYWYGGNTTVAQPNDAFVRGFMLNNKNDIHIPCSQELVHVIRTMFAQAPPYTGVFCSDMKSDKHDRVKMMEINARFCGSMAKNQGIFTASFVPLSYAVLAGAEHNSSTKPNSDSWPNKPNFVQINTTEAAVLQSGGGWRDGVHVVVDRFNHTLLIDKPDYK